MRHLLRTLILSAGLGLPLAATTLPPAPAMAQTNRIVAVVNGDIVTAADIEGRRRLFALNAGLPVSQIVLDRLSPQVTRLLIDERLRLQEAQRRRVAVTDEDIASALADIERRNGLPPGGLVAQLRRASVEPRVLFDQLRVQIAWSRLIRAMLGAQATPGAEQVADFIAAARARTGQQEFLVSEIFVPVDEPAEEPDVRRFVDEIVSQLRAGVPFPVAATQFSQAQTAIAGGDLGWVGAEALDPEVVAVVAQMPPGAIANPIRVAGGFQIVALRQRREVGRDMATMLTLRQLFLPFSSPLDPQNPTQQQIATVERARGLANSLRSCEAVEAAARTTGSDRPVDPGQVRLESMQPPQLRSLIGGLAPGRASQPVIAPDGVAILMVCSREQRNEAEMTPELARQQIARDRAELLSRQMQRDLRRRAQIEMRS
jgi:peptidyl-prolyl cis-trans isomerase SurA